MGEMCDFLSSGVYVTLPWVTLGVVSADLQAFSMSPFLFFFFFFLEDAIPGEVWVEECVTTGPPDTRLWEDG